MLRRLRNTSFLLTTSVALSAIQLAVADGATLKSRDDAVFLQVEVLGYDDEKIIVMSNFGEFTFDRANVICEGTGCPPPVPALPAAATTGTEVTLTTKVGAVEISGDLIDFTGTEYVVLTPTGEYRMRVESVTCAGAACPETAEPTVEQAQSAAESPVVAMTDRAQPDLAAAPTVTLTTKVGAIEITGKLLEFTGKEYVLFTPTGEYRLQAGTVSCAGPDCPAAVTKTAAVAAPAKGTVAAPEPFDPANANLRIASADAVGLGLLPSLWQGYAKWLGMDQELVRISDTESLSHFIDESGKPRETHFAEGADPARPFAALIDRSAEFGMASRPPNADEAATLRAAGAGDLMSPRIIP